MMSPELFTSSCTVSSVKLVSLFFVTSMIVTRSDHQCEAAWQDNLQPRIRINSLPPDQVVRFRSDQVSDHFRLLDYDDDSLVIGAKNFVYNVSAVTLSVQQRIEWRPSDDDIGMCRLKGKREQECHNYIRVVAKKSADNLLVCGTNAFNPKCRDYVLQGASEAGSAKATRSHGKQLLSEREFSVTEEKRGEGLCPYDPTYNSTYTFVDGALYVGTVGQFSGADPLIYRTPLRTEKFDLRHLNDPQFVSSMHIGEFVYFFFRESAIEFINCGKAVYSRVARVCTNDRGGPHVFKDKFTTFLKARLNCSIPGEVPFYFNELQSTSRVVNGSYPDGRASLIYSVLTTGPNTISGSAVCAFFLGDIEAAFNGSFKGQEDKNSNWLPVINSKVPEPRPGTCVHKEKVPDETLNFIANHPLMDQAVPAYLGRPIVVHTGFVYRYTCIAVDAQVEAVNGETYDVLFIGTDHGHVLKVINTAWPSRDRSDTLQSIESVLVEDVDVFGRSRSNSSIGKERAAHNSPAAVTNLIVQRSPYEQKLIVVSGSEVQGLALFHCHLAQTCHACVRLQDPYCAWSPMEGKCTNNWRADVGSVQNIKLGRDDRCRDMNLKASGDSRDSNIRPSPTEHASRTLHPSDFPSHTSGIIQSNETRQHVDDLYDADDVIKLIMQKCYRESTMAIACTLSIVLSLVVGFVIGFFVGKQACKGGSMDANYDPNYKEGYMEVDRMHGLIGPDLDTSGGYGEGQYEPTYTLPPGMNVGGLQPVNRVLNKTGKISNHLSGRPNGNAVNSFLNMTNRENKATLHKHVKRIYL